MELQKSQCKERFEKLKNFMKDKKHRVYILIICCSAVVFFISYNMTYKRILQKPITIYTAKKILKVDSNKKIDVSVQSKLKDGCKFVKKVSYIMEIKPNFKEKLGPKDITVNCNGKAIKLNKGKYEFAKEEVVNCDKKYPVKITFAKKGSYDLKVYAQIHKEVY